MSMRLAGGCAALVMMLTTMPALAAEAWRYQMPDGSVGMTDDYGKIPDGADSIRRVELPDSAPAAESAWGGRLRRWLDERAAAGRAAAPQVDRPGTTDTKTADREALLKQAEDAAAKAASAREAWRNGPPPAADTDTPGAARKGTDTPGGVAGMPGLSPEALSAPHTKAVMILALTATMTSGLLWRTLVALVLAATAIAVWKLAALSDGKRRWAWRIGAIAALAVWLALALPPAARAWQVDFAELVDAWQAPSDTR